MAILPGAEPFFLPGGSRGVLIIHGFTGSPSEMRLMGNYLNQQGYTVFGPRLCGHGTCVEEMAQTAWPHWYSAVEDGYHILRGLCASVAVVGLSMGGLLALKLSAEYGVSQVVAINSPIFIADRRMPLLPVYRLFQKFVYKKRRKINIDPLYNVCYERTPLNSLYSLTRLIKQAAEWLPQVKVPTLLIQSRNEHTVCPQSAQYIYEHLGTEDKQLIWLENSGHVATLDVEHRQVFAAVSGFLAAGGRAKGEERSKDE